MVMMQYPYCQPLSCNSSFNSHSSLSIGTLKSPIAMPPPLKIEQSPETKMQAMQNREFIKQRANIIAREASLTKLKENMNDSALNVGGSPFKRIRPV
jgi:hypothetical protein